MSAAFVPAMIRLCESCATDDPSAPSRVSPKPLTKPRPIRPERLVPLNVRDQHHVALGVECPLSVQPAHAAQAAPGDDLVRNDLDHRTGFVRDAQPEHRLRERPQSDRVRVIKCPCRPLLHTSSAARRHAAVLDHRVHSETL